MRKLEYQCLLLLMMCSVLLVNGDETIEEEESRNQSSLELGLSTTIQKKQQQRGISFYIPDSGGGSQHPTKKQATKKPAVKYSCVGKDDEGHYEHPDCKKYWQCLYVGTIFETAVERKCPIGTMFHPIERVCEISTMLTCEGWRKSIFGPEGNQPAKTTEPVRESGETYSSSIEKPGFSYQSKTNKNKVDKENNENTNNFFVESSENLNSFNFNQEPLEPHYTHKIHHKQPVVKQPTKPVQSVDYFEKETVEESTTIKPTAPNLEEFIEVEVISSKTSSTPVTTSAVYEDYSNDNEDTVTGEDENEDDDESEYYDDMTETESSTTTESTTLNSRLLTTLIPSSTTTLSTTTTSTTTTTTTTTTIITETPTTTKLSTTYIVKNEVNNKYTTLFSSNLLEKLRNYDRKNESFTTTTTKKRIDAKNLTILSSNGKMTFLIPFDKKNQVLDFNQTTLNYLIQQNSDNTSNQIQIDNSKQTVTTKTMVKSSSTTTTTTTPIPEEGEEFYDDEEEEIDEEAFESEDRSILDSDLLLNLQLNTEMDIDTSKTSEVDDDSVKEASPNKQKLLLTKGKGSKEGAENGESGADGYRRIDYSTSSSSSSMFIFPFFNFTFFDSIFLRNSYFLFYFCAFKLLSFIF